MIPTVQTRVLVLSDTHGAALSAIPEEKFRVAMHCGDLTEESKLEEYRATVRLLSAVKADLKLVIAGNHDWTLDDAMFRHKIAEMKPTTKDITLVEKEYGHIGDARAVLESEESRAAGIVYLDEGTHKFQLTNGALLTIYASPFTPSVNDWGFSYDAKEGHTWEISPDVNVAITHGPPRGVLDHTLSRERAGSLELFAAVARARPQMHCFGHIHEAWGAKSVRWTEEPSEEPSHFTDIDNDQSQLFESLSSLRAGKFDDDDGIKKKAAKREYYREIGHRSAEAPRPGSGSTLFVNAAIEGESEAEQQLPWVVDLQLPMAG